MVCSALPRKALHIIYRNLIWSIIFAFCLGGCIYNLREIVNAYADEPTAVTYRIHPMKSLKFPKLGICSLMPLNVTKLLQQGYSLTSIGALHWHFTQEHYTVAAIFNALYNKQKFAIKKFSRKFSERNFS